jgi:cystathionine gamma-synthase
VFYPKHNPSRGNYDAFRTAEGGYGGLLSVVFHNDAHAITFYDAIDTAKGPSLGTNFTLTSPYTILAHYTELEWAAKYGVEKGLVRISVGLEEMEPLVGMFETALAEIEKVEKEKEGKEENGV